MFSQVNLSIDGLCSSQIKRGPLVKSQINWSFILRKGGEKANNACQSLSSSSMSALPVFNKATDIRCSRHVCCSCKPPSAQGLGKVSCCCCKHPSTQQRHTNEQSLHRCLFLTSEMGSQLHKLDLSLNHSQSSTCHRLLDPNQYTDFKHFLMSKFLMRQRWYQVLILANILIGLLVFLIIQSFYVLITP